MPGDSRARVLLVQRAAGMERECSVRDHVRPRGAVLAFSRCASRKHRRRLMLRWLTVPGDGRARMLSGHRAWGRGRERGVRDGFLARGDRACAQQVCLAQAQVPFIFTR